MNRKQQTRIHVLVVLLATVPFFLYNGRWGTAANGDTLAVALPAWSVATEGTLDLTRNEFVAREANPSIWYVQDAHGRTVSNRPPGLIALAIPAYLTVRPSDFTNAPATATAFLVTVAAVLILWCTFRLLVGVRFATAAAITFALGTTTWSISSAELWPHGPNQLWAAIAVASLSMARYSTSGLAFAFSITTRPITAIFASATGLLESWRKRDWKPAAKIAGFASIGVSVLLLYNRWLFGSWSIASGYSEVFTGRLLERFELESYLANLWAMFFSLRFGVLIVTPVVGIAVYAAVRFRSKVPGWAKSAAFAGLVYLLVHAALNRASGGLAVFYRYPLEVLALAAPALVVGAYSLWRARTIGKILVSSSALLSVLGQMVNVSYLSCFFSDPVVRACIIS